MYEETIQSISDWNWIYLRNKSEKSTAALTLHINHPINTHALLSADDFIQWCNYTSRYNPCIYVNMSVNANAAQIVLNSIFRCCTSIIMPKCETIQRKMILRYKQTGFPLTIKTKCMTPGCSLFCLCTQKYPLFLCRFTQKPLTNSSSCYPTQLYCSKCIEKDKTTRIMKNTPKTLDELFSAITIDTMIIDDH